MRRAFVGTLCLVTTMAAPAAPSTIRVDWSGQGDYVTIQEGIDAAVPGDTVLVAVGTYGGPSNRDLDFGGKAIVLLSESGAEATVIDCEGAGRAFMFNHGETLDTIVRGFTITNGMAEHGGAVWCSNAMPDFVECRFLDNTADFGGAVYAGLGASIYLEYCAFTGNLAHDYGGAVYSHSAQPYIDYCEFTSNSAGISGGAVSVKTGTVARILDCIFTSNAAQDGGAIYVGTFAGQGSDEIDASLIGFSTFSGNTANRGGAIFFNSFSWVTTSWCTFVGNAATEGGAVYAQTDAQGSLTLQNCTLVFNSAENGGGICSVGESSENGFLVTQTIIAMSTAGNSVYRGDWSPITIDLSLAYGNDGGDQMSGATERVLYEDPLFCNVYAGDYNLCENSGCRAPNNPWGFLIGSHRQYCDPCTSPVTRTTWGALKSMYR